MYKLHYRLWIAISVSTLAIVSTCPVLAKPQPRAKKVVVTSQIENKAVVADDEISPPPVEAVLARVKLKSATPAKVVRTGTPTSSKVPSTVRAKNSGRHVSDRSLQGISNLIDNDRVTPKHENFSAVNRLID
jgi:hypothetical protein